MTDEIEIELTKGQAGIKGWESCPWCGKYIEEKEDSVRIGIDFKYEWIHLSCFVKKCDELVKQSEELPNPSKRDIH
jgi:hypothetical protein